MSELKRPEPPKPQEPQRTKHGHVHGEAFCLMWYVCRGCGHRERIWNSRDGVTPFGSSCPSCGDTDFLHSDWKSDEYAPNHQLWYMQKFWRDGTPDEAEDITRRMIARIKESEPGYIVDERQLIESARNPPADDPYSQWKAGWPMLAINTTIRPQPVRRRRA